MAEEKEAKSKAADEQYDELEEEEEEEEESVDVVKFTHEGVDYLQDGRGTVYDIETSDEIGSWDSESNKLTLATVLGDVD